MASIHAAAAGYGPNVEPASSPRVTRRGLGVLTLLAAGADTQDIAKRLGYSDGTIDRLIRDMQLSLRARNRIRRCPRGFGTA